MKETMTIEGAELQIKEYQGQRVVTFMDIDTVHQRAEGTARRNFNTNKKHLIEGEDYFVRKTYEAKTEFNIVAPNGLVLITESGYLMLVKSFRDDLAWKVQRDLVNTYFKAKEAISASETTSENTGIMIPQENYIKMVDTISRCADTFQSMIDYSTINYRQQQKLLKTARERISHLLGGAHSDNYKRESRTYFKNLWQDFCKEFECGSYRDLNPSHMKGDAAIKWIGEWKYIGN